MAKWLVYVSRERTETNHIEVEAEDDEAAHELVNDMLDSGDLPKDFWFNWYPCDSTTDVEIDEIEEVDDDDPEPEVPLGQRGFGQ